MVSNDIEVGRCTNRSRSSLYDDDGDEELGLPGQQINADNSVRRHRQRRRADGGTDGRIFMHAYGFRYICRYRY